MPAELIAASAGVDTDPHVPTAVLVVDDTDGNRYAVSRLLRGAGMEVTEAATGREALRLAAAGPDLVVLDINLPDVSGYEVCRRIKSDPHTSWIPVMHVSASYVEDKDRAYGLELGADAYLTHPLDPAVFLATTRALLRVARAEQKLRQAAQEWRVTFDSLADSILLVDARGMIVHCNHAAARLLDVAPTEASGRTLDDIMVSLGVDARALDRAAVGGNGASGEIELRGRHFGVSSARVPPVGDGGERTIFVLTDITARREGERERERLLEHSEQSRVDAEAARAEAEAASKAKSDFLAVMSHELRTPLNAIGGFVELIQLGLRGPVTDEQLVDLEKVKRSQLTLLSLINDLLSFAKLESGAVHYDLAAVPVRGILERAGVFIEPQVSAKGLRYVLEPTPSSAVVLADADKLQQVVLNLLSNAIKFTDPGGTIAVSCEVRDDVFIRVRDTGRGIPDDKLDAIFEPFVQVDQRRVRDHAGTGLGLAISRDLARGMGGDLTATSRVGEGSTFTLRLRPASQPDS